MLFSLPAHAWRLGRTVVERPQPNGAARLAAEGGWHPQGPQPAPRDPGEAKSASARECVCVCVCV